MADIRKYFTSSRNKTESSGVKDKETVSNFKLRKRTFIESDSEDEKEKTPNRKKKIQQKTFKKISAISDSSDDEKESEKSCLKNSKSKVGSKKRSRSEIIDSSSEEISPSSKKKPIQKKLERVDVKSRFFKEASVLDVFGSKPVKRDNSRLKEVQEKLKKSTKASKNNVKQEEECKEEEFEAALLQLDDVGSKWISLNKNTKSDDIHENKRIENDANKTKKIKSPEKNKTSDLVEKVPKENKETVLKEEYSKGPLPSKISSKSSVKLSFRDKLKQFSALSESSKQIEEEINEKTPMISTEKLLSVKSKYSSDSDYCSQSSNSNLQDSVNSDRNEMTSQPNNDITSDAKNGFKRVNLKMAENPEVLNKSITNNMSEINDTRPAQTAIIPNDCIPWVEKYKPDSTKKIIGQQGDQSNLKKLTKWLNDWYKNNTGSKKPAYVPGGWSTDKTGSAFRAALLSGPPGVGKTTTVSLVCKELGFDIVEFNASDTRSKKLLEEEVSKLLTNTSITSLFGNDCSITKKHVLVMDEVDGMAGTEDRGGIQELIHLIKITKVPIICMCNDRNHPKIRSLVNYCFDLRFQRPRLEQIKGYMKTVCFKEKLDISPDVLTNIITSSNNDVRLVLNHLSMLAADKSTNLQASKKYVKLSPWDALRKIFSKEDHKSMSIHDKFDLFFYDYSITPLFVQENYLMVKPLNTKTQSKVEKMKLYAQVADCISTGDQIDREIRSSSAWSLLPTQAIFSSYAPGEILEGYCSGQIAFPAWLGKNSKTNKIDRLLQEIQIHTRLKISASKEAVNLEYAPYLRNHILQPLIKDGSDGAKRAIERLQEYDLLKEDLESLSEICSWSSSNDSLSKLDSKVKAAFTRLYNKNPPMRPYSLSAPIKKNFIGDALEEELSEDDDGNEEADAMILVKKKQLNQNDSVSSPSTSKTKPKAPKNTNKKKKK